MARVLTRRCEHFFRRAESIRFGHSDGEPDEAQQEIDEV